MDGLKFKLAGVLGRWVVLAIGRSMRCVAGVGGRFAELRRSREPVIMAFWHNKLFYMSYCIAAHYIMRGGPVAVLISSSRDGEYMARVAAMLGARVARGSSTRSGGSGFRQLCEWAEQGTSLCIAPDGPRGPRYEPKDGTVFLAQKTGLPILPMSYRAKGSLQLKSWDGFVLPFPFTSVEVKCGEPIRVPKDLSPSGRREYCSALRKELMDLERQLWH
ncbi:lysophospholipid acyltransferase family protein [Planctomycetota bacterium]